MNKRQKLLNIIRWMFVFAFILIVPFGVEACSCHDEDKAEPTTKYYSVKFLDYDNTEIGVQIDNEIVYEQKIEEGHAAVAPINPSRTGYRFDSWDKDFSSVSNNMIIHAQYVQVCEVLFLDYDLSVYDSQVVDYGKNASYPSVDPTRNGYRFDHWDGNITHVMADVEIVAVYVKQYTVTFVDYDNSELKTQVVDEGASATAPASPQREGYIFDHWDTEFDSVMGNITVKAVYRVASYKVTFVDHDGSVLKAEQVYNEESATAPDIADENLIYIDWTKQEKKGYMFSGWDKDFACVKEDLTITAVYTEVTVPILFVETNEVESGVSKTVSVSVYIVSPITFSGLNIDVYYDGNLNLSESDIIVKNVFATQNRYNVTLDTNENTIEFSWVYSTEYALTNNYAEVFEMQFKVDKYASTGDYLINILPTSYYVKDLDSNPPLLINGAIKIV